MRIYVVRHRGIADPGFSGVLRDYLVGDDAADMFAETQCYREAAWESGSHIGFHQYRRAFLYPIAGFALIASAHADPWRQTIPVSAEWLRDYNRRLDREFDEVWQGMASRADILVPRPLHLGGMTMGQHYASAHDAGDWEIFASLLRAEGLDDGRLPYLTAFNMFVMRTEVFVRYMQIWRRVMDRAAAKIIPPASGPQRRVFGFLSERLFTAWLYKLRCDEPGLVIESLPVLVAEA